MEYTENVNYRFILENEIGFCVMDDYGQLVAVDPFPHHTEGCVPYLAPNNIGAYELFYPHSH